MLRGPHRRLERAKVTRVRVVVRRLRVDGGANRRERAPAARDVFVRGTRRLERPRPRRPLGARRLDGGFAPPYQPLLVAQERRDAFKKRRVRGVRVVRGIRVWRRSRRPVVDFDGFDDRNEFGDGFVIRARVVVRRVFRL